MSSTSVNSISSSYSSSYVSVYDTISDHVHSVSIPDHLHSISINGLTTSEEIEKEKEWKNEEIIIEPKSYSVIFIMKIDDNT